MGTTINDKLGNLATITELQDAIHNGRAFELSQDGTLPQSSSLTFLGRTQSKEVHFHSFNGNFQKGAVRVNLYEDAIVTADGTPVSEYANMNRNYSDNSDLLLFSTPTVTDNGLKIGSNFAPLTGGGANTQPAGAGVAEGRVLKPNTDYLFVLENLDNADCDFGINFVWSENSKSTTL